LHLDGKGIQYEILHDMTELDPNVFFGCSLKLADEGDFKYLENFVHVEVRLLNPNMTGLPKFSDIFTSWLLLDKLTPNRKSVKSNAFRGLALLTKG
jgi:hypothetical protein